MSPKSLLRHPQVISPVSDFISGKFREVIDDANADKKKTRRVLLCTGKIFYDLQTEQTSHQKNDVAIVRIEQLHPFPEKQLDRILSRYGKAEIFWVQEEPENMGALCYIRNMYRGKLTDTISRKSSASPATGYHKIHTHEQAELMTRAFSD
jgi:2-oxoglutarate dehydrogenase E1 component